VTSSPVPELLIMSLHECPSPPSVNVNVLFPTGGSMQSIGSRVLCARLFAASVFSSVGLGLDRRGLRGKDSAFFFLRVYLNGKCSSWRSLYWANHRGSAFPVQTQPEPSEPSRVFLHHHGPLIDAVTSRRFFLSLPMPLCMRSF